MTPCFLRAAYFDRMTLGYGIDYFVDIARQTAFKRYGHKKFWNVVLHTILSWIMAWTLVVIGQKFMPPSLQLGLIVFKCLICVIQEPLFGFAYSLTYSAVAYHAGIFQALDLSFLGAFLIVALCLGLQVLGHVTLEGDLPTDRPSKGDSILFMLCDGMNEFLLPQFHFTVVLFIRLELVPMHKWRSDMELRKLMDRVQEIKYGKKSP